MQIFNIRPRSQVDFLSKNPVVTIVHDNWIYVEQRTDDEVAYQMNDSEEECLNTTKYAVKN